MAQVSRRQVLGWLSASGLTVAAASTLPSTAHARGLSVYTNATLIDGTGARPRPRTTIVTAGGRIVAVGNSRAAVPVGVDVVDLRGKYVIPGLIDMHAHTLDLEKIFLPLYVANGVTSIREMMGHPFHHSMRSRIEAGDLLGPRFVLSTAVDGRYPFFPGVVSVRSPAEARAAVQQAKRDDADFIKVFSHLEPDSFTALADAARRLRLPFAGHLPDEVSTVRGTMLGMRTMEHSLGVVIDVSSRRDELRRQIAANPIDPANPVLRWSLVRELERVAYDTYDPRRAAEIFAGFRRHGTAMDPTLTVLRNFCFPPETFKGDPLVKYVPPWLIADWDAQLGGPWTPEQVAAGRRMWARMVALTSHYDQAGVTITAGTDCGLPAYGFPGFNLHKELEQLVAAGLSPMRSIQAGTRNAARAAGIDAEAGTVEPGKSADLLILDADPLRDITNTRRIHAVVNRGRLIDQAARLRLLAAVEAIAPATPRPTTTLARSCCTR